jgi:hypothetical protein
MQNESRNNTVGILDEPTKWQTIESWGSSTQQTRRLASLNSIYCSSRQRGTLTYGAPFGMRFLAGSSTVPDIPQKARGAECAMWAVMLRQGGFNLVTRAMMVG